MIQPAHRQRPSLRRWLRQFLRPPQELLSSRSHSRDFSGSRAEYIYLRQRLLSWVFAVLALIWIPLDALFLDAAEFRQILFMRLLFAGGFLLLALWPAVSTLDIRVARLRLAAIVLIPGLFYVASLAVLGPAVEQGGLAMGYRFLPFVMLATLAVFPLTVLEGTLYALAVGAVFLLARTAAGLLFSVGTLHDLWLLGLLAAMALWVQVAQIHMLLRLYREATRDALTGLVNRRVLMRWLEVEREQAQQQGQPLSLLLFDLDLFKRINDAHGHIVGDRVLRAFADMLTANAGRHGRLAGRYGGEEFLVILPGEDLAGARALAERLREACGGLAVTSLDGQTIRFTTSVGVAQYRPGEAAEAFLARVDDGLYGAKEAGRDLVVAV